MKIALCQLNPRMGDIAGNTARVESAVLAAQECPPDLFVFSELFIQGYPPRDLLERRWFIADGIAAIGKICALSKKVPSCGILVGAAMPHALSGGRGLSNSALLVYNGEIVFRQDKSLLPTYDVFDEARYFDPARSIAPFNFKGESLGITICEDAWNDPATVSRPLYTEDPVAALAAAGATLFVNLSGSPFFKGKQAQRQTLFGGHAKRYGKPFVFVNEIGGNDELVFDGTSMVFNGNGELCAVLPSFEECIGTIDTQSLRPLAEPVVFDSIRSVHDALVLGIRDYMHKCGFTTAVLGLSGGIDSAVTAALAAAAIGAENVLGVSMPSRYSSSGSFTDAETLATNLGCSFKTIPIEPTFQTLLAGLTPHFEGRPPDLAEENLQARIRGTILMALSNKFNRLLLSTGNKSEMAVGYCTMYGDMNGGLSVIADVPKIMVYELARYINRTTEIIPQATITKPPSAELRPDQKDQDTLPAYDILDKILELLIEDGWSRQAIIKSGFDSQTVDWIIRAVKRSEYKRRQAAPGLKVTTKAFGCGRRFPIAAEYNW